MSDYRDERFALQQRIAALEVRRGEAHARLDKQSREVENARGALDARPRESWSRREWAHVAIGIFMLLLSLLPIGIALQGPDPKPCPRAPVAALPNGLGLYVWGTLESAPHRQTANQRCAFWIDVATDRTTAAVTGVEITCNGESIHRWSKSRAASEGSRSPAQIVAELHGYAADTYELRYEGITPGVGGATVRIDTEQKAATIETVPGAKWVFALDGRLRPRSSSTVP